MRLTPTIGLFVGLLLTQPRPSIAAEALYVADTARDRIVIADPETLKVVDSIPLGSGIRPFGLALSADELHLFVTAELGTVATVDLARRSITRKATGGYGYERPILTGAAAAQFLVLGSTIFDTISLGVVGGFNSAYTPTAGLSVLPASVIANNEHTINRLDVQTRRVAATYFSQSKIVALVATRDGKEVWYGDRTHLVQLDSTTLAPLAEVPLVGVNLLIADPERGIWAQSGGRFIPIVGGEFNPSRSLPAPQVTSATRAHILADGRLILVDLTMRAYVIVDPTLPVQTQQYRLERPEEPIEDIVFSSRSARAWLARRSGIYELDLDHQTETPVLAAAAPVELASDPTGTRLAVADQAARAVLLINVEDGAQTTIATGGEPSSITFHPSGNAVFVAGHEFIRAYDLSGRLLHSYDAGWFEHPAVSPDGKLLFVTDHQETVAVFDVESAALLRQVDLGGPGDTVFGNIAFDHSGNAFLAQPDGYTVWRFDLATLEPYPTALQGQARSVVFDSTRNTLLASLDPPYPHDRDEAHNSIVATLALATMSSGRPMGLDGSAGSLAISADHKWLAAAASLQGGVQLISLERGATQGFIGMPAGSLVFARKPAVRFGLTELGLNTAIASPVVPDLEKASANSSVGLDMIWAGTPSTHAGLGEISFFFDRATAVRPVSSDTPDCKLVGPFEGCTLAAAFRPRGCEPGISCDHVAWRPACPSKRLLQPGQSLLRCTVDVSPDAAPGLHPVAGNTWSNVDGVGFTGGVVVTSGEARAGTPSRTPYPTRTPTVTSTPTATPHHPQILIDARPSTLAPGEDLLVATVLLGDSSNIVSLEYDVDLPPDITIDSDAYGSPICVRSNADRFSAVSVSPSGACDTGAATCGSRLHGFVPATASGVRQIGDGPIVQCHAHVRSDADAGEILLTAAFFSSTSDPYVVNEPLVATSRLTIRGSGTPQSSPTPTVTPTPSATAPDLADDAELNGVIVYAGLGGVGIAAVDPFDLNAIASYLYDGFGLGYGPPALALDPSGQLMFAGSVDRFYILAPCTQAFSGDAFGLDELTDLALFEDGGLVWVAAKDRVTALDLASLQPQVTIRAAGHSRLTAGLASRRLYVSPYADRFNDFAINGILRAYDLTNGELQAEAPALAEFDRGLGNAIELSRDQRQLYVTSAPCRDPFCGADDRGSGRIVVLDAMSLEVRDVFTLPPPYFPTAVGVHPDGRTLWVGATSDEQSRVFSIQVDTHEIREILAPPSALADIKFSASGQWAYLLTRSPGAISRVDVLTHRIVAHHVYGDINNFPTEGGRLVIAPRPPECATIPARCPCDCNRDGATSIDEILVNVGATVNGAADLSCSHPASDVAGLVACVQSALGSCSAPRSIVSSAP